MARRDHENDITRLSSEYRMTAQRLGIRLLDGTVTEEDVEALRQCRARLDRAKAEYERVYA